MTASRGASCRVDFLLFSFFLYQYFAPWGVWGGRPERERERERVGERESECFFPGSCKKKKTSEFHHHFFCLSSSSGFGRDPASQRCSPLSFELLPCVRLKWLQLPLPQQQQRAGRERPRRAAATVGGLHHLHHQLAAAAEAIGAAAAEATPRRGFGTGELVVERGFFFFAAR